MKELFIPFNNPDHLQTLSGEKDAHLKLLAELLCIKIKRQEKGLTLSGEKEDVELASDFFTQIQKVLLENQLINENDLKRAVKILAADRNANLFNQLGDKIKTSGNKKDIFPKTPTQKAYLDSIRENDLVFGVGPAGTGKTYLAMAMAVQALLKKEVKRIILSRPAVEAGEKLGFLPGDLTEKVDPYLRPLYDALYDFVDYEKGNEMIEKGIIEVAPLAFMRGRTLSNAFVILDEAQNANSGQMKMFLTRLGQGSKCLITGDITQIDLPPKESSGLIEATKILADIQGIAMVYFSEADVIRHRLVSDIIKAYARHS